MPKPECRSVQETRSLLVQMSFFFFSQRSLAVDSLHALHILPCEIVWVQIHCPDVSGCVHSFHCTKSKAGVCMWGLCTCVFVMPDLAWTLFRYPLCFALRFFRLDWSVSQPFQAVPQLLCQPTLPAGGIISAVAQENCSRASLRCGSVP